MPPPRLLRAEPPPVHLVLARDRAGALRRGSPWLYKESLRDLPAAPPGSLALVKEKGGKGSGKGGGDDIVAVGMYDPSSPLAFRAVAAGPRGGARRVDDALIAARLARAAALRAALFPPGCGTDGYRLVNGEGDGLPGLVVDVFAGTAVLKLDGAGPAGFYSARGVAAWLASNVPGVNRMWLKHR